MLENAKINLEAAKPQKLIAVTICWFTV